MKPLRAPADEDLHDLIAECYEQASTIVTSNLDFDEWDQAFATNRLLASATLDRLRHNAYCLELDGPSYRDPKVAPEFKKGAPKSLQRGSANGSEISAKWPRQQGASRCPWAPRQVAGICRLRVAGLRRLLTTFAKEGKELRRKAGGDAHAKQFKRLRRTVKRQRTILGALMRNAQRGLESISQGVAGLEPTALAVTELTMWLERAERIRTQQRHSKNKLYALHAPEVECIGKGKARKPTSSA